MATNNLQSGSVHARVSFRGNTLDLLSGNPFPDNNVSSVEKLAVGLYKINYSTSLSGADHAVAANCQIARGTEISPGCMELVATDVDSATIAAKLAGEGYGSATYFDPDAVDFIASSNANVPVNLSINTVKAWACIKNGTLADGSNIESVTTPAPGTTKVTFTRGFSDYTIIATASNGPNGQATASVTYDSLRDINAITLYTFGFGESINRALSVAFTPEYLNLLVFGNYGSGSGGGGGGGGSGGGGGGTGLTLSLDQTRVSGACEWGALAGGTSSCVAVSDPVTVTVTGGTAPYTYVWSYVSGDTGIEISAPAAPTTTFSKEGSVIIENAYFRVRVTDASGNFAVSQNVEVILTRTSNITIPNP